MKREYEAFANTVEEAIAIARRELGISEFEGIPEVLQYPKKGFFGKIKQQARVRVTYESLDDILEDKPKAAEKPAPKKPALEKRPPVEKRPVEKTEKKEKPPVKKAEPVSPAAPVSQPVVSEPKEEEVLREPSEELMPKVNVARQYLEDVFRNMGVTDLQMTFLEGDNKNIHVQLAGEGIGAVIGKRGETLDSIQYLVCLVANHLEGDYVRFTLNAGNYREKREETLKALAARMAKKVLRTGRSTALEPMNPYERRIIHSVITEIEGVYSKSTGEEPNRKVVIKPAFKQGGRPPRGGKNNRDNRGYNNNKPKASKPYEPKPETPANQEPAGKPAATLDDSYKLYSKIEL